jgi:hypothetical protein
VTRVAVHCPGCHWGTRRDPEAPGECRDCGAPLVRGIAPRGGVTGRPPLSLGQRVARALRRMADEVEREEAEEGMARSRAQIFRARK